jgi:hypothetical protein
MGPVKKRVRKIAQDLAARIAQWDEVEAILLGEAADIEIYDPYFIVDLDVYVRGRLPDAEERRERLADVEGYESSTITTVDRFVVGELPVSVHYMDTDGVDTVMRRIVDSSWVFHETGTNMFYRIERGEVLHSRGGWLASIRAARAEIPGSFWEHVCMRAYAAAERALADLGASVFRSDDLFFLMATARLLRGVSSFLFAANRQFEPSGRMLTERIRGLPLLPPEFLSRLDNLVGAGDCATKQARRDVAEAVVQSLIPLGSRSDGGSPSPDGKHASPDGKHARKRAPSRGASGG